MGAAIQMEKHLEQWIGQRLTDPFDTSLLDFEIAALHFHGTSGVLYQPLRPCWDFFAGKKTSAFHEDCDLEMIAVPRVSAWALKMEPWQQREKPEFC